MSDIFISYDRKDRERVRVLAEAFLRLGWTVFWDPQTPAGVNWDEFISDGLDHSRCVVVIWSSTSVKSRYVKEEAREGREREILIPVIFTQTRLPFGFGSLQTADLTSWGGDVKDPEFEKLQEDLVRLLGPVAGSWRRASALTEWNQTLCAADLHEKYCRMSTSPFVFYCGTANLYWADIAADWRLSRFGGRRTRTWIHGDAHAESMGAYNDQKGRLAYGLYDFDESVIGDYQCDLWRVAISLVLVARRNGGFSGQAKARIVNALAMSYLDTMAGYVGNRKALKRSFTVGSASGLLQAFLAETQGLKSRKKMLEKWTVEVNGERRFDMTRSELAPVSAADRADIEAAMPSYGRTLSGPVEYSGQVFAIRDIARRLSASIGSLGTPRYCVLIHGEGDSSRGNRILDVKHQRKPSAYDYLSKDSQVDYHRACLNDAHRQAVAYQALGRQPDAFMGWVKLHSGYYSVRERSPFKETFPTESLKTSTGFVEMARVWAEVLATDHARAVRDLRVDGSPYSIAKEVTRRTKGPSARQDFLAMVRDYAFEYANQVEADYDHFLAAVQPGGRDEFLN